MVEEHGRRAGVNNALQELLRGRHTEIKVEKHFACPRKRIHDVAHQWLLDEERRGVYICFAKFHAIMVDADARKIYDPCFPTSMALGPSASTP